MTTKIRILELILIFELKIILTDRKRKGYTKVL
jgi:hypothetical protein